MTRKHTIEVNEVFFCKDSVAKGAYFTESSYIGKEYDAAHFIHEPGDTATAVYRMNVETMVIEDITEEVASAWLDWGDNGSDCIEMEIGMPLYVSNSKAWERWKFDEESMRRVYR